MKKITLFRLLAFVGLVIGFSWLTAPSAYAAADSDNDSVVDSVEDSMPNDGDNNYDFTPDSEQENVASLLNPNDQEAPNAPVTLQVDSTVSDCREICPNAWKIDNFKPVDPKTLPTQPDGKIFPLGMFDIKLSCQPIGESQSDCNDYEFNPETESYEPIPIPANLKLIFNRVLDTSNWTTQKYDPNTDSYKDFSDYITIEPENTDFGYARTVLSWSLIDGGEWDSDGVINNLISDPIGPSVPVPTLATGYAKKTATTPVNVNELAHTGSNDRLAIIAGIIFVVSGGLLLPKRENLKG